MCLTKLLIWVKITFLMIQRGLGNNATADNVTSLRRSLLQNYDPYLRPRKLQADPVVINVSFVVRRLHDLSEKNGMISILGYFEFSWIDEFLSWDKEKYQNINDIVVKTDDIWWPTIGLASPIGDIETLKNPYGIYRISSTGLINWSPGGLFSAMCDMNVQTYPFDTQNCKFTFVVLGYKHSDVIINANPNVLKARETKVWTVVSSRVHALNENTSRSGLVSILTLQRKPFFVILTLVMPLSLLSFLNILVFLIPIESGEKTSYAITTFLAYSIYLSAMGTSLPDDAENFVYLTLYIELLMFLSVLITFLVMIQTRLGFYHGDKLLPFCNRNGVSAESNDVIKTGEKDTSFTKETKRKTHGRTWGSRIVLIDRILFIFFLCVLGSLNVIFFTLMSS